VVTHMWSIVPATAVRTAPDVQKREEMYNKSREILSQRSVPKPMQCMTYRFSVWHGHLSPGLTCWVVSAVPRCHPRVGAGFGKLGGSSSGTGRKKSEINEDFYNTRILIGGPPRGELLFEAGGGARGTTIKTWAELEDAF